MSLKKINPTLSKSWKDLKIHFEKISSEKIYELFNKNPDRFKDLKIEWGNFLIDFSKNKITTKTIDLLINLSNELGLKEAINNHFKGSKINETENRSVLHTALRSEKSEEIIVDGENIIPEIHENKEKLYSFCENVINGNHKGFTRKEIKDIVNIGIGGSDLGPSMVTDASAYYSNHLKVHFASNIDGDHINEILKKLNPETTLFIIVSKTFTTQETITNANTFKKWFLSYSSKKEIPKHFVAVSSNLNAVIDFGIDPKNIFPMKDWVGGRFSLWSSVGLSIALSIGPSNFEKLLNGAKDMDEHFKSSDFKKNIPVTLALISIWYNNFYNAETEAIIPYTEYLNKFPSYLQQAVMESNGKSTDRSGDPISYQTGGIIWGASGTNSQHAFFQLLHQGTKLIPIDFIGFKNSLHKNTEHHEKLMSNFFAQTEALMKGKNKLEVKDELNSKKMSLSKIEKLIPFKTFNGDRPSTSILIDSLTPHSLGSLISIYEHKIFVQGYIWNIFSYDQWGVELGKDLAKNILDEIKNNKKNKHDPSTENLIKFFKK